MILKETENYDRAIGMYRCLYCNRAFVKKKKYCNGLCRSKKSPPKKTQKVHCIICNNIIYTNRNDRRFCSNKCARFERKSLELHKSLNREYFLERANFQCEKCKIENNNNLEIHHIIPIYKGGKDKFENLIVLCDKCHQKEHHFKIKVVYDE